MPASTSSRTLNDAGNFVPVNGKAAALAQGTTPIDRRLGLQRSWPGSDGFDGNPQAEVVVPSDAVVAGVYIQAISAYAPHPNAAKLWMEYLYSDEGQLGWLAGYCHPIRFNDMAARSVDPGRPDRPSCRRPTLYAKAVFPTLDEQDAAKKADHAKAGTAVVGANVQ